MLYQRSAAQGNVASLLALGDAHFYGKGTDQDWSRASAIYYEVSHLLLLAMQYGYLVWQADVLLYHNRSPNNVSMSKPQRTDCMVGASVGH